MKLTHFYKISVLAVLSVVMLSAVPAQAVELLGSDDHGVVTVPSPETHKNLYTAGGTVMINGKTTGDLYTAGGTVSVDGDVEQDLTIAGGTVSVNSKVGGDVRVAGGTVTIDGLVAGDVVVVGGTIIVSDRATIGGDLVICGGSVTVNGKVAGRAWLKTGEAIFGSTSEVSGPLVYQGKNPVVVREGAKISSIENRPWHHRDRGDRGSFFGILSLAFLIKLLACVIAGLLVVHFFPRRSHMVVESMHRDPWRNLGIGLLAVIAVPVVGVILTVTLVGAYLGMALLLWFMLVCLFAGLLAALFLGAWLIKVLTKKPELRLDWQAVLMGTVIYLLLSFVPVVGWLAIIALFLMAFGSLVRFSKKNITQDGSV